jgi:hypothetical protein
VLLTVALAGCGWLANDPPQRPDRPASAPNEQRLHQEVDKADFDECSRQFDENEAGFQTCLP